MSRFSIYSSILVGAAAAVAAVGYANPRTARNDNPDAVSYPYDPAAPTHVLRKRTLPDVSTVMSQDAARVPLPVKIETATCVLD